MNKLKLNYAIDISAGILFLVAGITGIVKFPNLLPLLGISYRSLNMQLISFIHDWSALIALLLVIVHIILHWQWIASATKGFFGKKK
jgi:uncharacterized membrane protein